MTLKEREQLRFEIYGSTSTPHTQQYLQPTTQERNEVPTVGMGLCIGGSGAATSLPASKGSTGAQGQDGPWHLSR